ncbi:Toxin 1, PIN domain [Serinicoccus hydrothermalis]|uniref:Ribonuclease VapC n=1 Tax=Serinicoccus hydrothermalis TaxID=1758689 RepID=A0A1B1NGW3_9MICO|nr:type II toxin-antitoxin system VapC family toxin [Serinicoccus hydrothermalis]ANS80659.1 Toxin 1, PIN domain [Serinicoccus hydrothermalis]
MKVVDANVLLYAVNPSARHHEASRRWLDGALSGSETVGFSWLVLTAFVRLSTKVGLFPHPLQPGQAIAVVRAWLGAPGARMLEPGGAHLTLMESILSEVGSGGNLVSDAHLAAIALEANAGVVSYDTDFSRFERVRCSRPDDLLGR